MNPNLSYRPDIDGLRAIAVLPVMLFHAGIDMFSGGYVGVDVFFVISGFLITSIIYKEVIKGDFSYLRFYERRARRIFPALYFVVLISIIPAWFLLIPDDFMDFTDNIIGVVVFASNIVLWLQSNYFDQAAELKPLLHTWSLAVEEQYYVFLPILLAFFHRYARKFILLLVLIILIASLGLAEWASSSKPTANYYLLPTRAWELFIGSLVSLSIYTGLLDKYSTLIYKSSNVLGIIGLLLILIPVVLYTSITPFPGLWALPPTVGTALVMMSTNPNTITYKLLSNKFLVGIGLISYSAYLWHQPVYAYVRQQPYLEPNQSVLFVAFIVSLFLAALTWKFVEQPFRDRNKISTTKIWLYSLIGALILISVGLLSRAYNGFESRFTMREPLTQATFDLPKSSNGWCFYSVDTNSTLVLGSDGFTCHLGDKNGVKDILLFGDSFAGMYEPFWNSVGKELSSDIHSLTTNWCHPSLTQSFWWKNETRARAQCMMNREFLKKNISNYDAIVISAVWTTVEQEGLISEVFDLINYISTKTDLKIIIMPQPPRVTRESVLRSVYYDAEIHYAQTDKMVQTINEKLKSISTKYNNVIYIKPESIFTTSGNKKMIYTTDGLPYSWDGGHISIYGSTKAGSNFLQSAQYNSLQSLLTQSKDN